MSWFVRCFAIVALGFYCSIAWAQAPVVAGDSELRQDPYMSIAQDLARYVDKSPFNVGVGNFLYENTEQMSAFSSLLRDELARVLPETGKFKVITRSRLADLQNEGKFKETTIFEPGTTNRPVKIKEIQGIVRGRFYYKYPDVTISAELVWLEGGDIKNAKVKIPVKDIGAKIWPAAIKALTETQIASAVEPQNVKKSTANIEDIESRIKKVPHDFALNLMILEGKRDFAQGETISYRVWASEPCHIALLCHQVDGSTVVLFPNGFCGSTWIPARKKVDIPGAARAGFEITITPPFGADVVQVIGCTKKSALHQMIEGCVAAEQMKGMAYRGISRGMVVQAVEDSLTESASDSSGPRRWAEAHIVVCTYPKYGR